ncbi:hypothetical protein [uncultured Oscillibacter sp.]|uniref:hypothetical protein n=1 Tax=uncultured Oscillibacter sp. TaxID=876091 RepID=UPI002603CC7F|nr:hypothetical protein [uncultured Oscillibacter sp.]
MKNRFCRLSPACVDKKDAGKNPALRCGIFAPESRFSPKKKNRKSVSFGNTVSGTPLRAEIGSPFPQSGLVAAISAAMRGEFGLPLVPDFELPGNRSKTTPLIELFQNYGVSVKSVSSSEISSS